MSNLRSAAPGTGGGFQQLFNALLPVVVQQKQHTFTQTS
jgi:hypothetical protein